MNIVEYREHSPYHPSAYILSNPFEVEPSVCLCFAVSLHKITKSSGAVRLWSLKGRWDGFARSAIKCISTWKRPPRASTFTAKILFIASTNSARYKKKQRQETENHSFVYTAAFTPFRRNSEPNIWKAR